jgi:prolyl-tRNA synthetase
LANKSCFTSGMQRGLNATREADFANWYQAVVREADLAENSPVRGAMIIKPWGYGIWELIQQELDRRIKASGHQNVYFPLLIPLSFFAKEASHVEGFAKEMAVVTHHRLAMIDGVLQVDPEAKLEEPLVVRPTSETIIGDAFHRWVRSYRDLPLLINQWANIVRWEMRTRLFLRTSEFLWQEGHTAHADRDDAMAETMTILELYRDFAERCLAMPVVAGEKPEHERFPGAEATFSIEAMMQDGKALQAATSHYLGASFSEAQNIRYQSETGDLRLCHTTSWGITTRLIGGVIMTHGDDDGLRLPPAIAPRQVVIVPMLRDRPEDTEVLAYADAVAAELGGVSALGWPVRVLVDKRPGRSADKRWDWVRRGAPLIVEIGPRDAAGGQVTFIRRDRLWGAEERIASTTAARAEFVAGVAVQLAEIQTGLFDEAKARLDANVRADIKTFADLTAHFGPAAEDEEANVVFKGWVRCAWSKPTGEALDAVVQRLKSLKLTIRNAPTGQSAPFGPCLFTGEPGVEEILIARAY